MRRGRSAPPPAPAAAGAAFRRAGCARGRDRGGARRGGRAPRAGRGGRGGRGVGGARGSRPRPRRGAVRGGEEEAETDLRTAASAKGQGRRPERRDER